ncbi:MFS transporter [Nocardia carnea]|uniref:MFS transporter n=1 Tax=Nocardia carnea TaxID=37328 RepID=UPI0024588F6C|nr:MFS transporter [Nocardia carnea]
MSLFHSVGNHPPISSRFLSTPARIQLPAGHFILTASIVVTFLASTSVLTPIYPVYQSDWGLSSLTITVVFAIYSLAVLLTLLTFGALSDHIGRKPVLISALLAQIAAMAIFATAEGVYALLAGRMVQGLAIGAALGAVGATLIDLDRARSTLTNAVIPVIGCSLGILVSTQVVEHLPHPTRTIYLIMLVVFAVQAVGVATMPETGTRRDGALASLRPTFAVPQDARRPLFIAAPVVFAVWALAGLYGSLGPALVDTLHPGPSPLLAGLPIFLITAVAVVTIVALHDIEPQRLFEIGVGALVLGLVGTLAALHTGSLAGLYASTVIAGIGFGGGFQGGIRTVVPHAGSEHRAGVLSVLYICCYLGFGAPAVVAGYLSIQQGDPSVVTREYAAVLLLLAVPTVLGFAVRHARVSVGAQGGGKRRATPLSIVRSHQVAALPRGTVVLSRMRSPR